MRLKTSPTGAEQSSLSLFSEDCLDSPKADERGVFATMKWSHSRRNSFETCSRQYFYKYYGGNLSGIPSTREKLFLLAKRMSNRHLLAGNLLHASIDEYFKSARRGYILAESEMRELAKARFQAEWNLARRDPDGLTTSGGRKPGMVLSEFYRRQVNADELFLATEEKMLRALRNFAAAPEFSAVREAGCCRGALSEKWLHFNIGCGVTGKIDLIYGEGPEWGIVDWKMGDSDEDGDESLQLAAYALWVEKEYGGQPNQIRAHKAFLGNSTLKSYSVAAEDVEMATVRILQDVERMARMDRYGKMGKETAFTPCAQPNVCRMCPFVNACPEGKECLNDEEPEFLP